MEGRKKMQTVAIVGAGIVGLAHAYAYAKRGWRVRVYERSPRAQGASVRNFGMIWPIGQPAGEQLELAMLSRRIWLEILEAAGLPYVASGSLHLTYHADEEAVAREFATAQPQRGRWVDAEEAVALSPAANPEGLRGALYSEHEVVVDPRLVLATLAEFLDENYGVEFEFATAVGDVRRLDADRVVVASGHDFVTLFPEVFRESGLKPCKLQMMRTAPQPAGWRFGPALAAGLTLRFYPSFSACATLPELKARIAETMPEYDAWGIHVLASPAQDNAITIGDSHEYDLTVDVFNKERIDELILSYFETFARLPNPRIAERWSGVYAKHPRQAYFHARPETGVEIITGLGGAGMTLSMGLAEKLVSLVEDQKPSRNIN
jgi:FAD dependent oxidoreductase TIGR03364